MRLLADLGALFGFSWVNHAQTRSGHMKRARGRVPGTLQALERQDQGPCVTQQSKREPKNTVSGGCDKGDARLSPRRRLPQAGVRVGDAAPAPGVSAGRGLHESDGGAAVRARGRAGVRGVAPARLWRPRPLLRRGGPRRALAVPARDHVRRVSARGAARPDRRAAARPAPGPGRLRGRGRVRPAVATARRVGRDVRVRVRGARGVGVGDARRRDAVAPRRGHRHELVAKARRPRGRGLSALR